MSPLSTLIFYDVCLSFASTAKNLRPPYNSPINTRMLISETIEMDIYFYLSLLCQLSTNNVSSYEVSGRNDVREVPYVKCFDWPSKRDTVGLAAAR